MKYLLFVSLCAVVYAVQYPPGFDPEVCTPPTDNGGRDFPKFSPTFRADVEWNDLIRKRTMVVRQYVSEDLNVGTVYTTGLAGPGITSKVITSARTGQFFYISDTAAPTACTASPLPTENEMVLPVEKDEEGKFKIDAERTMRFGGISVGPMRYNGTQMMNGVLTDVWQGCLYLPDGKTTLAVKYHLSARSWQTASGDESVPVRAFVSRKSSDSFRIEEVFNFIHYSTHLPANEPNFMAETFQVPEHSYCTGQWSATDLPVPPRHLKFEMEVLDYQKQFITYVKEIFDTASNLTRVDHDIGNYNTSEMVTEISDFNTGHTYHISKNKRCDVTPIANGLFSMRVAQNAVRIRTPEEFFLFDKQDKYPYHFNGMHEVRGIPTKSWISYRPYPTEESNWMATYQWYYSTHATRIKTDGLVEDLEPVQLVINASALNQVSIYNIFKFSEGPPSPRDFDISPCFKGADRRTFHMKLKGNHTGVDMESNSEVFIYWVQLSVEEYSGLPSIRIQNIQADFTGEDIEVSFTLLGVPKIVGNVVNPTISTPLEEATNKITEAVTSGTFQVFYMAHVGARGVVLKAIESTLTVKL